MPVDFEIVTSADSEGVCDSDMGSVAESDGLNVIVMVSDCKADDTDRNSETEGVASSVNDRVIEVVSDSETDFVPDSRKLPEKEADNVSETVVVSEPETDGEAVRVLDAV